MFKYSDKSCDLICASQSVQGQGKGALLDAKSPAIFGFAMILVGDENHGSM